MLKARIEKALKEALKNQSFSAWEDTPEGIQWEIDRLMRDIFPSNVIIGGHTQVATSLDLDTLKVDPETSRAEAVLIFKYDDRPQADELVKLLAEGL